MAAKAPPADLTALLGWVGPGQAPKVGSYDILAIGVQEAYDLDKWEKLIMAGMDASTSGRSFCCLPPVRFFV
eukprot:5895269-Pyramimonas_sp.AAC.2